MDTLLMIVTLLAGLLAFGSFASTFGTDSRDRLGDDWAR
jgi:hypothetical protein